MSDTTNDLETKSEDKIIEFSRLRLKCDGTRAETRFLLSAKRTSQFKSAGASVQSTTGSRGVRISGCNAGYTMFRGSVKSTGYPLHSPVSPSLPLPCAITFQLESTCLAREYDSATAICAIAYIIFISVTVPAANVLAFIVLGTGTFH